MADVKWIKLATEVFDNRKIRQIETMPDGDSILIIWFKLLCLAGNINDRGQVYFTTEIPYTDQMLSAQFGRPLATVQMALKIFQQFEMVEIIDDFLMISNWEKYQNVDGMERVREQTRKRVESYRERKKLECNVTSNATVTECNGTDIDIDIDKDNNIILPKNVSVKHKYGEYMNVMLTDQELEKLKSEFPDWQERIERLSTYIESSGKKYKSHLATIRNWARMEKEKKPKSTNKFNNIDQRTYGDELEAMLLKRGIT